MSHDDLPRVAELLHERNRIDDQIAAIMERPMTSGHLGEWIAAQVFDIELEKSATTTAFDGLFRSGPLQGRRVNVKWYLQREGILDMTTSEDLDDYLVMTGPVSAAVSSHGRTRPWRIDSVYLFDAHRLQADLHARGRSIGTASSIRTELWSQAEIYPKPANRRMSLTDRQVEALQLFAPA
ncbi:hypothetical protein [Modestobacter sp. URMC 112]